MIIIDLNKAKAIGHEMRRAARSAEFAPLDIKATIPSEAAIAEADRQVIREKYAAIQNSIDIATTPEEIKEALNAA